MAQFHYQARNAKGVAVDGLLDAASEQAAATQLLNNGITPIQINAVLIRISSTAQLRKLLTQRQPSLADIIFFTRQLHTLLHAGVPIIRAFQGLAENITNPVFAEVLRDVAVTLESGRDMASSLARHPKIFNNLIISMIQVGEQSGDLDGALLKLSQYLEREKDTRDRIKQAMRYPIMVIGAISVAMVVINLWVMPTFTKIFSKFKTELPWQTRLLIGFSDFMQHYWPLLLVLLIAAAIGIRRYINTPQGRLTWDRLKLRIPVVGSLLYEALLARFATSFALTLRSGVPLIQGLNVVANAVDNAYVGDKIRQMRNGIERGDTLTRTAANTQLFSPLTLQMLNVGEETGMVDDMLENVASYYDREVDFRLKNLSSAIEPILIVVIGVMVLILALGVFLPMWELTSVVRK
jgi:MSHA biogenesis protein MshG